MKQCQICNRRYSDEMLNFCLDDGGVLLATEAPEQTVVKSQLPHLAFMKQCPNCERTYYDDTLNFCLDDGGILFATQDPEQTLVKSQLIEPEVKTPTTSASSARLRVLIICLVTIGALAVFFWLRARPPGFIETTNFNGAERPTDSVLAGPSPYQASSVAPSIATSAASPTPAATAQNETLPTPDGNQAPIQAPLSGSFVGTLKLIIPVPGVKPDQLLDTFTDARSEGRVHDAIDIPAAAGTQVVAAADGEIIKLFQSERGGTTIYQLSPDNKLVFYYAHLQRYADGLAAGKFVKQGEVIGYVGDSGNAGAGNYHLHFSISVIPDPKRYWEGTNINPYPLLRK